MIGLEHVTPILDSYATQRKLVQDSPQLSATHQKTADYLDQLFHFSPLSRAVALMYMVAMIDASGNVPQALVENAAFATDLLTQLSESGEYLAVRLELDAFRLDISGFGPSSIYQEPTADISTVSNPAAFVQELANYLMLSRVGNLSYMPFFFAFPVIYYVFLAEGLVKEPVVVRRHADSITFTLPVPIMEQGELCLTCTVDNTKGVASVASQPITVH